MGQFSAGKVGQFSAGIYNQRIPAQAMRIENDQIVVEQPENPQLAELVIAHGLAQAMQAEQEAVPYFLYMDRLVRQIREELFGPIKKNGDSASYAPKEGDEKSTT